MQKNLGLKWLVFIGGFGFCAGFFGPIIFVPGANQGPLLGIFITGPLGILVGLLCWTVSANAQWTYQYQIRIAKICCVLFAVGIAATFLWPKPEWPGRIYEIKVTSCAPSSAGLGESILQADILHERQIKKEKPLFRKPFYFSGAVTGTKIQNYSFYIPGNCGAYPIGFTTTYFVTNHPTVYRDKAVLEPLPDFARGL
jgi:hypothetical protein